MRYFRRERRFYLQRRLHTLYTRVYSTRKKHTTTRVIHSLTEYYNPAIVRRLPPYESCILCDQFICVSPEVSRFFRVQIYCYIGSVSVLYKVGFKAKDKLKCLVHTVLGRGVPQVVSIFLTLYEYKYSNLRGLAFLHSGMGSETNSTLMTGMLYSFIKKTQRIM